MGTAIKHPVPDRVKPSFVIFDIRALWRSGLSVKNYKWRLNPVWHRMLYSCCSHMEAVGVKQLRRPITNRQQCMTTGAATMSCRPSSFFADNTTLSSAQIELRAVIVGRQSPAQRAKMQTSCFSSIFGWGRVSLFPEHTDCEMWQFGSVHGFLSTWKYFLVFAQTGALLVMR